MRVVSFADRFLARVPDAFHASVLEAEALAKANAPVDTGDFRRRIKIQWLGPLRAVIGTDHPGGKMREFGGTIVAKRARYLRFKTRDGRWHQVRRVTQRPGGYSNGFKPWLRPAAKKWPSLMTKHLRGQR